MSTGKDTNAHQKFTHDLSTSKTKGLLEKLYSFLFREWVLKFNPSLKGPMFFLKMTYCFGIFYRGINF